MEEIKIYSEPLTAKEHSKEMANICKTPIRFHLIDVLKEIRYGRPVVDQHMITKWIMDLEENKEVGTPFT